MKWLQVKTLEELKILGNFKTVRAEIQGVLGKSLKLKVNSWKRLLEAINTLQRFAGKVTGEIYFKSEAARIIYTLLELDGDIRLEKLKAYKSHYLDKDKAKKWRDNLMKIIHPDNCDHPNANIAANKLTELYKEMIK